MIDVGLSSLATFAIGLYAVRVFEPATLGAYALVFSAYLLGTVLVKNLIFIPTEVFAVSYPPAHRLSLLRDSLRQGLPIGFLAALALPLWLLTAPPSAPDHVLLELTVTGMAITLLAPFQEHVRQMFHIADRSWNAAATSALQLVVAIAAVGLLSSLDVGDAWVPLGALATAQFASVILGLILAHGTGAGTPPRRLTLQELTRSGRWLLPGGLIPMAVIYLSASLVGHLAGAAALGFAEAARVVAQPGVVLALGLSASLSPRLMQAAREGDRLKARHSKSVFYVLTVSLGIGYLVLAGFDGWWNPIPELLPTAYAVEGLVIAAIAANILFGIHWPFRYEMLGAGYEQKLVGIELVAGAGQTGMAATATVTGPFAIPFGALGAGMVRLFMYRRNLHSHYLGASRPEVRTAEC